MALKAKLKPCMITALNSYGDVKYKKYETLGSSPFMYDEGLNNHNDLVDGKWKQITNSDFSIGICFSSYTARRIYPKSHFIIKEFKDEEV